MLYAKLKSLKAKVRVEKLPAGAFKRLGDDLRKAGTLAGVGLVGIIVANDTIEVREGVTLFICGVLLWTFGHVCAYIADKIEPEQKKQEGL